MAAVYAPDYATRRATGAGHSEAARAAREAADAAAPDSGWHETQAIRDAAKETADKIEEEEENAARKRAEIFLLEFLKDGAKKEGDCEEQFCKTEHAEQEKERERAHEAMRRACWDLDIEEKEDGEETTWQLPNKADEEEEEEDGDDEEEADEADADEEDPELLKVEDAANQRGLTGDRRDRFIAAAYVDANTADDFDERIKAAEQFLQEHPEIQSGADSQPEPKPKKPLDADGRYRQLSAFVGHLYGGLSPTQRAEEIHKHAQQVMDEYIEQPIVEPIEGEATWGDIFK